MNATSYVKRLSLMTLLIMILGLGQASYVNKLPMRVVQPDGSELDLLASGDEYHNWLHDESGFTIIPSDTGWYCYAEADGEAVKPSELIVGQADPATHGLKPGTNISSRLYKERRKTAFWMPESRDAPTTGTINNLVIYIRFSDEAEFGQSNSVYDGWFNTSTNSQKNYYLEASYNQLTVNTHFYPAPVNGYVVSWQDSHPRSYFQPYSTSNPGGYNGDDQRRDREFTLLQNACAAVGPSIPASLTIDSDNDGRVDNVVFIVKGAAGAWSSLLWPHRWSLYDRYVYINGKRVYDFNFQLQTFLASRGVGVICHEFFHTLGAPDLYHYTDNGIDPAGSWDIMETDKNPPQHMTAFMKWKYGDWIPSIPVITADQAYTLNPITSSTGQCYRINSNHPNQYYVVEFRKKTGTFESSIPNSGLLVYRIDTSCGNGNADGPPDELYIYRPGGTTTSNGTLSSANFSSEAGRVAIYSGTNPSPFLQDGSAGNLYLCEIGSSSGTTMSFRKGIPWINFVPNPYVQNFDVTVFPPDGWTSVAQSGSYTFSRVTSGTNPNCSPQYGAGFIKFNSDTSPAGSSALLVSPRVVVSDPDDYAYQVSFWMYRDGNLSTALDKVEIYLNTSAGLGGSPTLLGTIHRARQQSPVESIPGWKQYFFSFPISGTGDHYAILRAISAGGYNIYVDSFRLGKVPFPATLTAPAQGSTVANWSAGLSWQSGGGGPTGYKLWLGTNNPPSNIVNGQDLGSLTSYLPANLSFDTTYYWKVLPYGPGGSANDCPVWSFTHVDARIGVLPHTQNFDGVLFPDLPPGWTDVVNSSSTGASIRTNTGSSVSQPNSVYFYNSTDASADLRLVSPQLLVPIGQCRISFYARSGSNGYPLLLGTQVSPDGTFEPLSTLTLTNTHTLYELSLASYSGTNAYLVFKHGMGGTYRGIYLDDLLIEPQAQIDLAALAVNGPAYGLQGETLSHSVRVKNYGFSAVSGFTVSLWLDERRQQLASLLVTDPLAPGEEEEYSLSWTLPSSGSFTLRASVSTAGDGYQNNDSSTTSSVVYPPATFIPGIGDADTASSSNSLPFNFYWKNSVSETIYLGSELQMSAGLVHSVIYVNNFTQNLTGQPLKIWMANTETADLSAGWLEPSRYSLVFDGSIDFPLGANTIIIPLDNPFLYTGANLALRCHRPMDSVYYSNSNHFFYNNDTAFPNRSRYIQSDSTVYDPLAPSGTGTLSSSIPLTAFVVDQAEPLSLAAPQISIQPQVNGMMLSWPVLPGYYGYRVFASPDPLQWPDEPLLTVYEPQVLIIPAVSRSFYRVMAFSYTHDLRAGLDKLRSETTRRDEGINDTQKP
ncbi:MAG TPA: M6 family metalloprotease domain-containing protein [Candidatus Cloacimonadota bacterium]|nr:M6 family metalloprotease domain-containing protein [Candidatus Cloacimonadota bacterium]